VQAQPALSPSWYRVAELRPRLRSHVTVHRHGYRGERWYVVEDRISRRSHRFGAPAHFVIGLMNGRRSMQEIWEAATARLGAEAPAQEELIQLLGQLHVAEVMQCDVNPDVDEMLRRSQRIQRRGLLAKLLSPLAIRVPLLDPDRLLERTLPWYGWMFGRAGALAWLLVVGCGAALSVQHWDALTQDLSHRVLAPENLLILGLVFPLLKAMHEFGHACAVKAWGGEVHEMGIMFLVLMPVPYVDASSASAFADKRRRVLVGAAGMMVELFVASIALALWLALEPGMPRAVLFNVMLIAGISTVLFNANPLLRFDGYYILMDLIEIPNLRQRANHYLASRFQHRLFGLAAAPEQPGARERGWLVFFAVGSFVYRLFIMLAIALFVAEQYPFIGMVLALWVAVTSLAMPLASLAGFLAFSPRLAGARGRAMAVSASLAAALGVLLFALPAPSWTTAQGVVAIPEQSSVRAGAEGFVVRLIAPPGAQVRRDEPLVELADPLLEARLRVLSARKAELEARYQSERSEKRVRAQMTQDQLVAAEADLARARQRAEDLTLRSPADGTFALYAPQDLPGRFVRQGEQIGHVVADAQLTVRVVVPQQTVDLVRAHTRALQIKLAERLAETYPGRILREVPGATNRLPSPALSQVGGGEVALEPGTGAELKTLQTHFDFEIELPRDLHPMLGGRAYVRFEHEGESVGSQAWRWLRQQLLRRLTL
jgi:putative peptide zinc metalloprotease protein